MKASSLKIGHINIRSLIPSLEEFKQFITSNNFDVVGVSETWLNKTINYENIIIDGYRGIYQSKNGRGGGVGLFIKVGFNITRIENEYTNNSSFEQVWIRMRLSKMDIVLGCIYKPPQYSQSSFLTDFDDILSSLAPLSDNICCVGDFNLNYLNYSSKEVREFNLLLSSMGLAQVFTHPTRVTLQSESLIDLIIMSDNMEVVKCDTLASMFSDHEFIFCEIQIPTLRKKTEFKEYRNYKNIDIQQFDQDLRSIPWRNILDIDNADGKVDFINSNINALLDLHAPIKKIRLSKSKRQPWLDNVGHLMKLRGKALSKYKKNRTDENRAHYKSLRNLVSSKIEHEKKLFLQEKFSTNNNLWQELKYYCGDFKDGITQIPENLRNPDEINRSFISLIPQPVVDPEDTIKFYSQNRKRSLTSLLKFTTVSEMDVLKIISQLKSKACGIDGINIHVLHLCTPFILPFLTHLINYCISNSVYPTTWKKALVIPKPKKTSPKEYRDLRPISILPCLSKILEKIINEQLINHIEANNILPETQSGFRKYHNCSTTLADITDDIFRATDNGKSTLLVLLDYSRAFDTLDRSILLAALHYIGLDESAVAFFNSYFDGRTQRVMIDGVLSEELPVTRGVAQGSILGATLYIVYTSEQDCSFNKCKAHYYADDTQVCISFDNTDVVEACNTLNLELEKLMNFSAQHHLHINAEKCTALLFGPKNCREQTEKLVNIKIGDKSLKVENGKRNLGVIFDNNLRFDDHVSNCIRRAYYKLRLLYCNRHYIPEKQKKILCDSLVLSTFNFGDVIYGECLTAIARARIQRVQNSCLRFIFGIRKFDRISHKLKEIGWLNMNFRRKLHSACFYHNIVLNKTPNYLHRKIIYRSHVHNINIRNRGLITPPIHRTTFFERSFTYNIAKVYNPIPYTFKTLNIKAFKNKMFELYLKEQNEP